VEAVCLECGRTTVRLLPSRFPHICEECLFHGHVLAPPDAPRAPGTPWPVMLEQLHTAVRQAKPYWSSRGFEGWDG
jgi:hypothetical protein